MLPSTEGLRFIYNKTDRSLTYIIRCLTNLHISLFSCELLYMIYRDKLIVWD